MTLICSAKARKQFGLTLIKAPDNPPWYELWRLDLLLDNVPGDYGAIITNTESLFSFLVPRAECQSITRLTNYLRMRLQFTLIDAGSSIELEPSPPVFVSGNPRKVIGTMNDMIDQLYWCEPGDDADAVINKTPYSVIDYGRPKERFYGMAKGIR